jgi:hypothetical protein
MSEASKREKLCVAFRKLSMCSYLGRANHDINDFLEDVDLAPSLSTSSHAIQTKCINPRCWSYETATDVKAFAEFLAETTRKPPEQTTPAKPKGQTALHAAVLNGHVEIMELLLTRGAQIEATDGMNNTPLRLAVRNGHFLCVKKLLESGANPRGIEKSDICKDRQQDNENMRMEILNLLNVHRKRCGLPALRGFMRK